MFLAEMTAFGLIAYAASTPVYHIAQGLIFPWMTQPARLFNKWRFNRKYDAFEQGYGTKTYEQVDAITAKKLQQLFVYLSDYPIERDENGIPRFVLRYATRVGNITATYERYADTRYGVNAEGFWDHFLFLVPTEARKELDSVQAIAVGTLLSSAAGWMVFVIAVAVGIGRAVNELSGLRVGSVPISENAVIGLAFYGLIAAILFDYLSRVIHREYGRLFRACLDVHIGKFETWLDAHQAPLTRARIDSAEAFRQYSSYLVDRESH